MNVDVEQKVVKNQSTTDVTRKLTPRDIWGKVIIYLREHHAVALHIACGEITDVDIKDDTFIIRTAEDYLYELVEIEDNKEILKSAFASVGVTNFKVEKKDKIYNRAGLDIAILKEVVGDLLEIEGV